MRLVFWLERIYNINIVSYTHTIFYDQVKHKVLPEIGSESIHNDLIHVCMILPKGGARKKEMKEVYLESTLVLFYPNPDTQQRSSEQLTW